MIGGTCGAWIAALRRHSSENCAVDSRRFVELPDHHLAAHFKSSCANDRNRDLTLAEQQFQPCRPARPD